MTANIVRDKRRRFHPDPEHSDTLPGTYYWDPDIFAREKEEIFFKTWQFVGYVSELRSPGDFVTATIIDQPVFVIRAKEGALRAYYNVCMHRGHILLEGKGNVRRIAHLGGTAQLHRVGRAAPKPSPNGRFARPIGSIAFCPVRSGPTMRLPAPAAAWEAPTPSGRVRAPVTCAPPRARHALGNRSPPRRATRAPSSRSSSPRK